jgi:hypothetical protein
MGPGPWSPHIGGDGPPFRRERSLDLQPGPCRGHGWDPPRPDPRPAHLPRRAAIAQALAELPPTDRPCALEGLRGGQTASAGLGLSTIAHQDGPGGRGLEPLHPGCGGASRQHGPWRPAVEIDAPAPSGPAPAPREGLASQAPRDRADERRRALAATQGVGTGPRAPPARAARPQRGATGLGQFPPALAPACRLARLAGQPRREGRHDERPRAGRAVTTAPAGGPHPWPRPTAPGQLPGWTTRAARPASPPRPTDRTSHGASAWFPRSDEPLLCRRQRRETPRGGSGAQRVAAQGSPPEGCPSSRSQPRDES